ncbi:hypothetical protein M9Y10_040894 [Tritrichomonas musculus]|uniref:Saposin B-type domain-containing protein n=1 Tax=Tritrichomonas musculus TaxID=1915356 RepID=A0ABR2K2V7_9EUKA
MILFLSALAFSTIPRRPIMQKRDIDGFACDKLCKGIVAGARTMKKSGETEDEITTKLLSQCYQMMDLDKVYYPICRELSTKFISIVLTLIDQVDDDYKICVKLGYCSDLTGRFSRKTVQRYHYINKLNKTPKKAFNSKSI